MNKPLKILMLEDSESDEGLVVRMLKKSDIKFEHIRVETEQDFKNALNTYHPNLILSDHSLPQFNSLEAYKIFKNHNLKIPFILVTGTVSEEFAVTCLHEGIDDYILKDNLARLPSAISNALKKRELESKKRQLEIDQLRYSEKLEQQNKELEKTNKELDRFVYSASHELKAPLRSVLGLIKLTNSQLSEKQYHLFPEYLQMMETSINRLNKTVEEIVYYSMNNRTEIRHNPIDIQSLVDHVFLKLSYLTGIYNIEKRIQIDQTCDWYSDKDRLETVLENLISNAVIYRNPDSKDGYIDIKIEVSASKVYVSIEDNGIGIADEYLDKIFDMFYRVSNLSYGSGLGLYIVKETLEKLDGKIEVYSSLDKGSYFKLELPNLK